MAKPTRKTLTADKRSSPTAPRKSATKSRKPRAKSAARRRPGLMGWILWPFKLLLRVAWALSWRGAVVVALILAGATAYNYVSLPSMATLADGRARGSVTLQDRDGQTFAWRGDNFGGLITMEGVSGSLADAVIASEDKRFYNHIGVSPRGIAGAMRTNMQAGRGPFSGGGGSTITQQVAKLLCLGQDWDPSLGMTEAEFFRKVSFEGLE